MKKILLIGKLNDTNQSTYRHLQTEFNIQLSLDNVDSLKSLLKSNRPELVILSLVDMKITSNEMFNVLEEYCGDAQLIIIGTESEYKSIREYIKTTNVNYIERPASNEKIMQQCKKYFGGIAYAQSDSMSRQKVIMMIDDSAMSLRSMKRMLEPKYKTVLVTNGSQAFAQMQKHKPDLIILDYEMPVCNGERIFKLLKSNESTKDIPVIFLTGVSEKDNILDVLKLNPAGYFLKPPSANKLLSAIEKILD